MASIIEARKIVNFIQSLPDFQWYKHDHQTYQHMGATLADAGLQAGLNYRSVVLPRIKRLMVKWPNADTTRNFLRESRKYGMENLLNWSHPEKVRRVVEMTFLFVEHGIETERELVSWLEINDNRRNLMSIKGIGLKTVDYLCKLAGGASIAVDRHIKSFASWAGVNNGDYGEIKKIFQYVGDILEVDYSSLDHTIWLYVSQVSERSKPSIKRMN